MATGAAIAAVERGLVPDPLIRVGIRRLLGRRLAGLTLGDVERELAVRRAFFDELAAGPVAIETATANEQHYELPPRFFRTVLGPRLKYSACWWPEGVDDLATAETRTLELTCARAGLTDGMDILELGCGWGSLSLWMAERYPRSRILAVSNSRPQGEHIRSTAKERGLTNFEVVTADMNVFEPGRRFDRVVSLEMFEHMRNWAELYRRIATWLEPGGALFMHVFCHREHAYPYVAANDSDWMARHFFTGGIMPSDDQPYHFAEHLRVTGHWRLDGRHYSRTLEAWLARMDAARDRLMPLFREVYGGDAARWFRRWRVFFLACSELFRYRQGQEWFVSHYLLEPHHSGSAAMNHSAGHPQPERKDEPQRHRGTEGRRTLRDVVPSDSSRGL